MARKKKKGIEIKAIVKSKVATTGNVIADVAYLLSKAHDDLCNIDDGLLQSKVEMLNARAEQIIDAVRKRA